MLGVYVMAGLKEVGMAEVLVCWIWKRTIRSGAIVVSREMMSFRGLQRMLINVTCKRWCSQKDTEGHRPGLTNGRYMM